MKKLHSKKYITMCERELSDRIWFNIHRCYRMAGAFEDVPKEIREKEFERAEKLLQKNDYDDLIVSSEFEWGILNGQLMALKWVLGNQE